MILRSQKGGAGGSMVEPVGGDLGVYTSGIDASTCGRRWLGSHWLS